MGLVLELVLELGGWVRWAWGSGVRSRPPLKSEVGSVSLEIS